MFDGLVKAAIDLYTSFFEPSEIENVPYYKERTEKDSQDEERVVHATFSINE